MISKVLTTIILFLAAAILIALFVTLKISLNGEQIGFFLSGIVTAVLFGFAWFRLNDWIGTATSPGRPQTIRFQTDDTPSQITWAAIRATLALLAISFILLMIFLGLMSNMLGIDLVRNLRSILGL